MGPSDEDLVAVFQSGDFSAFDELVRRWEGKIQGAVYRIMGSEEDARDLSQEAFLRAFRNLGRFKGEARFSSWLYQIALNLCRDRMRRKKGKSWVSWDELAERGEGPVQSQGPSAVELVEASDRARWIAAAVASLSDDQREVVVLKEYQGLTFQEIADTLGIPASTVKTRLYRALSELRTRLASPQSGEERGATIQGANHGV
jgi:RNA polymerase sigma-70 factor, ECF subfamily